jgi:aldose sugar dehydrogenase
MRMQIFAALVITLAACGQAATQSPQTVPFQTQEMARFDEPWAMTFLPDGKALVTERGVPSRRALAMVRSSPFPAAPKWHIAGRGDWGTWLPILLLPKMVWSI